MTGTPFIKMHGLGNDFVVVDGRARPFRPDAALVCAIADRRTGVGCDQLIVIEPPRGRFDGVFMRIFNADGGEAEACGNAARCVARLVMDETGASAATVETLAGVLRARATADGRVVVDMGPARDGWRDIPLARAADTLHLGIVEDGLKDPVAVGVGNPHAVFFVADVAKVPLETCGPVIERHPLFPQRTNVEAVQVLAPDRLRVRVWERGAGLTRACGSGACAALVAAHRRGLAGREAQVILDGGPLGIAWTDDGHVHLAGPTAVSFTGALDPSLDA